MENWTPWTCPIYRSPFRCFSGLTALILTINIGGGFVCLFLAQQPPVGQGLIHEVSRSHTTTHHSR